MYNFIKREHKTIILSLLIGLCLSLAFGFLSAKSRLNAQKSLSADVFRLHVLANSDSIADQALKLKTRDAIITLLADELAASGGVDETRRVILANLPLIKQTAENAIKDAGYSYPVTAAIEVTDFPTRTYGGDVFPSGPYEALRVVIGDGGGQNWWCVMFPPLCLSNPAAVSTTPKPKFYILELFKKR